MRIIDESTTDMSAPAPTVTPASKAKAAKPTSDEDDREEDREEDKTDYGSEQQPQQQQQQQQVHASDIFPQIFLKFSAPT